MNTRRSTLGMTLSLTVLVGFGCASSMARGKPAAGPGTASTGKAVVELHHVVHGGAAGEAATAGPVATVGGKAPDFELPAYHDGKFTKIKLSSLQGKWVLLCFYPGDFTFV